MKMNDMRIFFFKKLKIILIADVQQGEADPTKGRRRKRLGTGEEYLKSKT